ncbi:DNA recombinase [Xaviernesmea oryzae]|uniref:DNA recombination protein RmuC homolog n=1 Tax=Xaviernesmea oryzae TaxID=464029 RepID=A0A1Q9AV41_9HYPH|nr:DNA recombination protein RmuC [Xaviernesmea oryzae]OLP59258.1 DNA recombinase [Xaviernesmea oryzae]SEK79249.1 DNA recombination protein RmuC [Xaviernesmea oryzae]
MARDTLSFDHVLFAIGGLPITLGLLLSGTCGLLLLLFLATVLRRGRVQEAAEARIDVLLSAQADMQSRIATLTEVFGTRQAELNRAIGERLDGMGQRIGSSILQQTQATHENLRRLQERLTAIDSAQANIQTLARDMAGLQQILSNKQTRGAFGQQRMETIVADGLPQGAYAFQPTLSNGARPDCTIRMPNGQPALVVDAKFPLEGWNAMRASEDETARRYATQQFRRDMEVHIRDIATKYLLPGETQDTAFLFVPSESIFADIHEHFEAIVQKAHRARIVIVSPSLLLLSIQVIQAILRDASMREQAHLIRDEVVHLMADLGRLDERVRKLQGHFLASQRDVEDILISSDKLRKRGGRIESLELDTPAAAAEPPVPAADPARPRQGGLKLRVVDEE